MRRFALSPATRWRLFWLAAVAAVLLSAWLSRFDRDLITGDSRGIVSLELAGSDAHAQQLLCGWQQAVLGPGPASPGPVSQGGAGAVTALDRAAASLRWDLLFLFIYPLAVGLGCFWAAEALERQGAVSPAWGGRLLRGLGWAQVGTWCFDLVETLSLRVILGRFRDGVPLGDALPLLARWCAVAKFALLAAGLAAILVGLWVRAVGRARRLRPAPGVADG